MNTDPPLKHTIDYGAIANERNIFRIVFRIRY